MSSRRSAPSDSLLGDQRPRICHVPDYSSSTGDEAIELAALAGLYLDDWQQFILRHALGERPDGKWAARTVGLVVGRQNGKGAVLEARELAGLFLLNEQLIIHTAHLQKTATNHFKRLRNLIRAVPEFKRRVAKMPEGKGSEAIELNTGQTIYFATRSGGGGRGLTADLLVFDEAMYLTEMDRSALVPSMAARSMEGNIQTWYAGSAVDQEDRSMDGVPFAKVREAGIAKNRNTAFFEWSLDFDGPEKVPPEVAQDPASHRSTTPSYNKRISPEWIEHERTVEMSYRGFVVERLGVGDWPNTSEDAGRVIPRDLWAACAERDPEVRIQTGHAFAIDVNPDRTWGSIGVAGQRADGLWQFVVADRRRRTDWIVDRAAELGSDYPDAKFVVLSGGPAGNLIADLEERTIDVIAASGSDYGVACSGFYDAIDHRTARYPWPEPELDEALSGARKGAQEERAWTWSRKASTSADISPLVAVTLALWGAQTAEPEYATVLIVGDDEQQAADPESEPVGVRGPRILSQEDTTDCFACRVGGCTIHS